MWVTGILIIVGIIFALFIGLIVIVFISQQEQAGHRTTADNCMYWTGDRSPVDWGTCYKCLGSNA